MMNSFFGRALPLAAALVGGTLGAAEQAAPVTVKVGTCNIRVAARGDVKGGNGWEERKGDLVNLIRKLDMDVFGFQEVHTNGPCQYLREALKEWEIVNDYGVTDPVAYRKSRFELVKKGVFWLSETPDVPHSKGWGAANVRPCVHLILRDRASGGRLCFVNTHTDHKSKLARLKGVQLILERMKTFSEGLPVVFVGDHNCGPDTEPAAAIREVMRDARDISDKEDPGPINTYHNWGKIKGVAWRRCDYIYVSDGIRVRDFVTHDEKRPGLDRYPTDHYLLTATVEPFAKDDAPRPRVIRNIRYLGDGDPQHVGDLYLPARPTAATPVVLAIHGGGWVKGDRKSWSGVAEYFWRDLGFAVFNVEYRFRSAQTPWPACGDDCVAAARHLLDGKLAAYGVRPSRIWTCGGSAGGHLALWTALSLPSERVAGAISVSGVADPVPDVPLHGFRYRHMIGEGLPDMSPLRLIKGKGPRVLLTHATGDQVVPIASARNFERAYRAAGNEGTLFEYPETVRPGLTGHCIWIPKSNPHRLIPEIEKAISAFVGGKAAEGGARR